MRAGVDPSVTDEDEETAHSLGGELEEAYLACVGDKPITEKALADADAAAAQFASAKFVKEARHASRSTLDGPFFYEIKRLLTVPGVNVNWVDEQGRQGESRIQGAVGREGAAGGGLCDVRPAAAARSDLHGRVAVVCMGGWQ